MKKICLASLILLFAFISIASQNLVDLEHPKDNSYLNVNAVNFSCSTNGKIMNISLFLGNETEFKINQTIFGLIGNMSNRLSNNKGSYNFTVQNLEENSYLWNCLVYKNKNTFGFAPENYTFKIDTTLPNLTLVAPLNNSLNTTSNLIDF